MVPVDISLLQQDLQVTFTYLKNNTSDELELKVLKVYHCYPEVQQGVRSSSRS